MRGYHPSAAIALLFAASACSGGAASEARGDTPTGGSAASDEGAPSTPPLYLFEGSVDVARASMTVTFRTPTGELATQATLPYGNAAGSVYFHTCGATTFNATTHVLAGNVQAVNLMTGSVGAMTAVIDSVSLAGVTPASGTIATYGTVAPNAADCGATQPWTFTNPTNANFTFTGHAEGTLATEHLVNGDFESGTGNVTCGGNTTGRTGWTTTGGTRQSGGCPFAPSVVLTLSRTTAGTFAQTFTATTAVGVLTYQHGSHSALGSCTYTVTFAPSSTVVSVTHNPTTATLVSAPPISVPAGTTQVTFAGATCTGSPTLETFDNLSLMAL